MLSSPRRNYSLALASTIAVIALSACATRATYTDSSSVDKPITLPAGSSGAAIIGTASSSVGLSNIIFVAEVDGKKIEDPLQTGSKPVTLAVGPHSLIVGQRMGGFFGTTQILFEAEAGVVYKLRAKLEDDDQPWYNKSIYAAGGKTAFWVEEYATGKIVSDKEIALVTVPRQGIVLPIFTKK